MSSDLSTNLSIYLPIYLSGRLSDNSHILTLHNSYLILISFIFPSHKNSQHTPTTLLSYLLLVHTYLFFKSTRTYFLNSYVLILQIRTYRPCSGTSSTVRDESVPSPPPRNDSHAQSQLYGRAVVYLAACLSVD